MGILSLMINLRVLTPTKALEEVAALVEGKVTPRLAALLDSIKDEKKVSLAVADPKLGITTSRMMRALASSTDSRNDRQCYQQASRPYSHTYLRLYHCRSVPVDSRAPTLSDPWPDATGYLHHVIGTLALSFET